MRDQLHQFVTRHPALSRAAPYLEPDFDWSGAKNFLLAMFLLMVALVISLNGAAFFDRGRWRTGAVLHSVALLLAFYVSVRLVPRMAAATPLRWLMYQVDYKFTREGGVYILATFVIALAALNTGNNLLFIIVSCLFAGMLISGLVSRIVLTGIELSLELPEHIFAQRPVLASLALTNRKLTLPSFSLLVSSPEAKDGKKPKGKAAAARVAGKVLNQPVYFPYVPRSKHSTQQVELTFPRRGRYQQDSFQVSSKFPFGFLLKTRKLPAAHEIVVYPPVQPTEEFYEILPLISGELESYFRGRGHDLYTIRDFQPGDPARHLDWKATARAQTLKVREFAREDERRVELIFDNSLPEGAPDAAWPERFERGVSFCACLAWHFYEIDAQMSYRAPDRETRVAAADELIYDILEHLALVEPRTGAEARFLEALMAESTFAAAQGKPDTFKIIVTPRSRGSIPTSLWTSSYFVFMDSLG
jgi:uncharacterized protein (DUF58 family)